MASKEPLSLARYRQGAWPTELADPADVIGFGGLDAEGRKRLAMAETPFVITGATVKFWPDGKESAIFDVVVMADEQHDSPWVTTLMLSLPKDADPENPGDRQRVVDYFADNSRPLGPFVGVLVPTQYPEPYFAFRKASDKVMAKYALQGGA